MSTLTLVYVEDSESDLHLIEEAVREAAVAINIVPFASAHAALQYFQFKATAKDVPPPDGVLIDVRLPDMNGKELVDFLLASDAFRGIPIYAITGDPRCQGKAEDLGLEPTRLLCKPPAWDDLLALVQRLWVEMRRVPTGHGLS